MARVKAAPPRGILRTGHRPVEFTHTRYEVEAPLDASIEHWWSVRWRLPAGEHRELHTLPHPSVHVVLDGGQVDVVGVVRGRYTWRIEGVGRVFGAKFRPGGFRGVLGRPVATLTGRIVPFASVVGARRALAYRETLLGCSDDHERVARATEFFEPLVPYPSRELALMDRLVALAATDRSIHSVEALRERSGLSLRALQRWFRDAVGISPKWMIQRYRLYAALEALESGHTATLASVAADLGYADQAHFARDFKALVGCAPSQYRLGVGSIDPCGST